MTIPSLLYGLWILFAFQYDTPIWCDALFLLDAIFAFKPQTAIVTCKYDYDGCDFVSCAMPLLFLICVSVKQLIQLR